MDAELEPKKGVTLTKGQLGFGSVIVMAIMILNPVKEWFFTREEGKAQAAQIEQLRTDLLAVQLELTRQFERSTDKVIESIKESESRSVKNTDRLERRVETLEANLGLRSKRGT